MNDPMSATEPTGSATWALAGLALTVLLASLGTSIANIALPTLATAFDASFSATQWVVIAYLLATTSFIVVAGKLGDILGQKRLLLVGLLVFAIGSLICGIAPSLWILILGRTVQGIGASFMLALTLALVGEIVPAERTGSAMGLIGTTSAVGTALGPSLGGFLIGTIGWRSVFLITVPLALLAVGLTFAALPNPRTRSRMTGSTFDLRGAALLFLVLLTYAISMTLGKHSFGLVNAVLLVLAIIAPWIGIKDPNEIFPEIARQGPAPGHPLGGDANGRDLLARIIYGTRASFVVGFGSVVRHSKWVPWVFQAFQVEPTRIFTW